MGQGARHTARRSVELADHPLRWWMRYDAQLTQPYTPCRAGAVQALTRSWGPSGRRSEELTPDEEGQAPSDPRKYQPQIDAMMQSRQAATP